MKKLLLVLILCYLYQFSSACDPIFFSFCTSATELEEDHIIVGKVIDEFDNGKQLEVLRTLRGQTSTTNVTIWDGTDIWCNGPFSMSVAGYGGLGDTVICILQPIDTIENDWDVIGDFRRPSSISYITYLNVVDGLLWNFDTLVSYPDFINEWETGACANIVSTNRIEKTSDLIFPNPASEHLIIRSSTNHWGFYSIYDPNGKLLSSQPLSSNTIPIRNLPSGLYFLRLQGSNGIELVHTFIKN